MRTNPRRLGSTALFLAFAAFAQAHPGHDGHELTWDFSTGFAHPFSGWDHLLAMIAIGWWAVQLGGRARWLIGAAFVTLLAASSLAAPAGLQTSMVEQGIAASVVVLGLLVATAARLPRGAAVALVGMFAVFHGAAHGAEMPAAVGAIGYGAGFVAASVALIGAGMLLASLVSRAGRSPERIAGAAMCLAGVLMLAL